MKFKENAIKPGMVIHCPKEEDARALLEYLDGLGYRWNEGGRFGETHYAEGDTYYLSCIAGDEHPLSVMQGYFANGIERGVTITEFSDLIEPEDSPINSPTDSPMSAVEVLEWLKYAGKGALINLFGTVSCDEILLNNTPQEIVDKITAYEAAKKAPEPVEVEWVDVCRIIQIQDDGFKKCVYEEVLKPETPFDTDPDLKEQTEAVLKKYISEHEGRYIAVIEYICRVKEDK